MAVGRRARREEVWKIYSPVISWSIRDGDKKVSEKGKAKIKVYEFSKAAGTKLPETLRWFWRDGE
ncbi:MAG: hypothetical protein ACI9NQ_001007 [Paracoccaceae bacterium]|jgi:hypothetical protein